MDSAAAPPKPAKLTLHHQVVINLVGYLVTCDWKDAKHLMVISEIATRLPMAPAVGQREVDALLAAASTLDSDPAAILTCRDAFARFAFWRAAQAQAAADAPTGETHAA